MPNYLARVAAAGGRTSRAALLPPLAPPIMPGPGPADFPAPAEAAPWQPETSSELVAPQEAGLGVAGRRAAETQMERPGEPSAVLPRLNAAAPAPRQSGSAAPDAGGSPPTPSPAHLLWPDPAIVQAPRALRPRTSPPLQASAGGAQSQVAAGPPEKAASPASVPSGDAVDAARRVQPAVVPLPPVGPGGRAGRAEPGAIAAAQQSSPAPARQIVSAPPTAADAMRLPAEPAAVATSPAPVGRAVAPGFAPAFTMPAGAAGTPSSRLTIGRIDVQVNNRPPVLVPAPAATPAPRRPDALDRLYLDRFELQP